MGLENITIKNSKLCKRKQNEVNDEAFIGLISGSNSLSATNVKVLNSSACYNDNNTYKYNSSDTDEIIIGGMFALLSPELIYKDIYVNNSLSSETMFVTAYSSFVPNISNSCFISPNTNIPIGIIGTLAIEKAVKKGDGNDNYEYMSRIFLNQKLFSKKGKGRRFRKKVFLILFYSFVPTYKTNSVHNQKNYKLNKI